MPVVQKVELTLAVVWQNDVTTSALDAPSESIQRLASEWYHSVETGGNNLASYLDFSESAKVGGRDGGMMKKTIHAFPLTGFTSAWDEFHDYCTRLEPVN